MRREKMQIIFKLVVFGVARALAEANATSLHTPGGVELSSTESTVHDPEIIHGHLRNVMDGLIAQVLASALKLTGSEDVSSECMSALLRTAFSLKQQEPWALRLVFSSGGIPNNAFEGSTASLGSYEQCVRTRAPDDNTSKSFEGQYCSLYLSLSPILLERVTQLLNAAGQLQGRRNPASWNKTPRGHFAGYRIGICAPSVCLEEEIDYVLQVALADYDTNSTVRNCVTQNTKTLTSLDMCVFAFIASSVAAVALGTCLELYHSKVKVGYPKRKLFALSVKTLLCFSCVRNFRELMNRREELGTVNDKLRFVHGVRVTMILWVMLGGAYFYSQVDTFHNVVEVFELPKKPAFQLVSASFLAVSTFFFVSGFLLSYITMTNEKKILNTNYVGLYILMVLKRYLRLTVPATPILLYLFLLPLFISGPQATDTMMREVKGCYKNWWTVFTHIVNFTPFEERCMSHFWYISNDMQLFLAATAIAIMMVRSVVWAGFLALCLATLGPYASGYITHRQFLFPGVTVAPHDINRSIRTSDLVFIMPYSNAGPYFVGMIAGYMSAEWPNIKMHWLIQAFFWVGAMSTNLVLVFLPILWNSAEDESYRLLQAFYAGGHQVIWGAAWSWIFYACCTGRAGLAVKVLSWEGFVIPARLTFGAYLVHYLVFVARGAVTTTAFQLNEFLQVKDALGVAAISFFLSFLVHLQYEAPTNNLLKLASDFLSQEYEKFRQKRAEKIPNKEGFVEDYVTEPTIVHFPDPTNSDLSLHLFARSRQASVDYPTSGTREASGRSSPPAEPSMESPVGRMKAHRRLRELTDGPVGQVINNGSLTSPIDTTLEVECCRSEDADYFPSSADARNKEGPYEAPTRV